MIKNKRPDCNKPKLTKPVYAILPSFAIIKRKGLKLNYYCTENSVFTILLCAKKK